MSEENLKQETVKHWPESKNIDTTEYLKDKKVLRVTFNVGSIYEYKNVEPNVWIQIIQCESIGSFISKNVKGFYEFDRIK